MIEQLRKDGFKVKVHHVRPLRVGFYNPEIDMIDNMLSRNEFEDFSRGSNLKFGDVVLPTGGFTEVEILCQDGSVLRGKHNFPKHKNFERKVGVKAAIGKALKGLTNG